MSKRRDAATGLYISEEESQTKDKATWTEERDKPKFGMDDRTHLLVSLYIAIKSQEYTYDDSSYNPPVVNLDDIKQAFKDCGVDIDKLQEQGKINID